MTMNILLCNLVNNNKYNSRLQQKSMLFYVLAVLSLPLFKDKQFAIKPTANGLLWKKVVKE